jgi:hypothetical protein
MEATENPYQSDGLTLVIASKSEFAKNFLLCFTLGSKTCSVSHIPISIYFPGNSTHIDLGTGRIFRQC